MTSETNYEVHPYDSYCPSDSTDPATPTTPTAPVEVCVRRCKKSSTPCVCMCKITAFLSALALLGLGTFIGGLVGYLAMMKGADPKTMLITLIVGAAVAGVALLLLLSQLINEYCSGNANSCSNYNR